LLAQGGGERNAVDYLSVRHPLTSLARAFQKRKLLNGDAPTEGVRANDKDNL
jgi:hypothetical protein